MKRHTSDISINHYCVHIVHVIKLSLLLMPSVILYFTVCHVFYCDVIGRLVLLLLINRLINYERLGHDSRL